MTTRHQRAEGHNGELDVGKRHWPGRLEEQRNPSGRRSFGAMRRLFEDEEHQGERVGWG
jgi:hypothetical protein